jgi:23S rRNA pseudouridine2604 synthase
MNKKNNPKKYVYYAYYKPKGIECTMNASIQHSLPNTLALPLPYFPLGRLDKESEGLLILTNDGKLYKESVGAEVFKEKEYHVTVDKSITKEFIEALSSGIEILGQRTRPARVTQLNDFSFSIVLTQGVNRQIRRMCYKMDYAVVKLIRTRFAMLTLDQLKPGDIVEILRDKIIA